MQSSLTRRSFVRALLAAGAMCGLSAASLVNAGPALAGGNLKFEIFADRAGEYRWRLRAANGQILATAGESYRAKASAKAGVERLRNDLQRLEFAPYEDARKETRWRLKAKNGQVVASSSEGYRDKADAEHAIALIKAGAADAVVADET